MPAFMVVCCNQTKPNPKLTLTLKPSPNHDTGPAMSAIFFVNVT